VRIWSVATGAVVRTLRHDHPLLQLALSPDGMLIAAVDDQGDVVIWTGDTRTLHTALSNGTTRAIAFSDDGERFIASGTDTKLYAAIRIGNGLDVSTVDGPTGEVSAVAFTRDRSCVITAGTDGLVQLWDADKGKLIGTRGSRSAAIHALATDGNTLWVGGADQLVRAWDIHTETRVVESLGAVMERVPWRLDESDVVRRQETGDSR
jgi:WD40 repeat protein